MIRAATLADVPALVALGAVLHATSDYRDQPYVEEKVAGLLENLIQGQGVVFAAVKDGEVVGGIAGGVTEHWFNHEVHAFEYSFFIAEQHRSGLLAMKLLLALEHWAIRRGATECRIGITTGINVEGTSRFYRYMGYRETGPLFTKVLHGH
jgi:GNAT superfamily N-acetyltransferase